MAVVDDGLGFEPYSVSIADDENASGFNVMRRRMAELGSSLTVDSAPGRGTSVTASIEAYA